MNGARADPCCRETHGCGPLLTATVIAQFRAAVQRGAQFVECSLDLGKSTSRVELFADHWLWREQRFAYPTGCKDRTIYHWVGSFEPVARYSSSLIKLVPTEWGPPTFEIDGIKMLPTAKVSPYADAERKVDLIDPRNKIVLDTCGGLGYFASWCRQRHAARVYSFEKNADVIWLRSINPWSPDSDDVLSLTHADVTEAIVTMAANSVDAVLHDPPRFGIAGELYAQDFYDQIARVLRRRGRLFHYTGTPNRVATGRDLAGEVTKRLQTAGFRVHREGDGLLASKE